MLKRKGTIHVLVRKGSKDKFEALQARYPDAAERLQPVYGDLTKPKLGLTAEAQKSLTGKIKHFFHLAAIYDLAAALTRLQNHEFATMLNPITRAFFGPNAKNSAIASAMPSVVPASPSATSTG